MNQHNRDGWPAKVYADGQEQGNVKRQPGLDRLIGNWYEVENRPGRHIKLPRPIRILPVQQGLRAASRPQVIMIIDRLNREPGAEKRHNEQPDQESTALMAF